MLLKRVTYGAAKALGLFSAARLLTRRKLRILAYHGVELHDESRFDPAMFIRPPTFAARLELLRREYPVLPLGEAVRRLEEGSLPPCAVAITIDDGFHGTAAVAAPLLEAAGLPATVYVTTWYVERQVPVFRLAMQYCFWKSRVRSIDVGALGAGVEGTRPLGTEAQRVEVVWELVNYGERHLDEQGRTSLLEATAAQLDVDLRPLLRDRVLHLMSRDEVRATDARLDVQLHTHRHRFPDDPLLARAELEENRRALAPLVRRPLVHFCYPSGFWSEALFPVLAAAGVETATTCEGGLNGPGVHRYALRRFFDGEHVTALEFEAELSGFAELLRVGASWVGRARARLRIDPADRRRGYPAGHGRTILDRPAPRTVPA
jgi:peptidoglycan/xylan/chitin deacetylase (PgdA/CDA1 family)